MAFESTEEGYMAKILVPEGTKDVPINKVWLIYLLVNNVIIFSHSSLLFWWTNRLMLLSSPTSRKTPPNHLLHLLLILNLLLLLPNLHRPNSNKNHNLNKPNLLPLNHVSYALRNLKWYLLFLRPPSHYYWITCTFPNNDQRFFSNKFVNILSYIRKHCWMEKEGRWPS